MKAFKFILIFIALLFIAVLVFVATFDANDYKPEIIEQVEAATGRSFTIDGAINLSLFPWIGLKVEDVALGNEKGFSAEKFAAIKQLDIKVNVLPLLKKEVQINTIRLHGLNVSLEVASNKSNNWSSLTQPDTTADDKTLRAETKSQLLEKEEGNGSPLQSLQVEGFEFVDATIHYSDSSSETKAKVSSLNLTTGAIKFNEEVDVSFGARIESNQPEIDTQLNLTTQLVFNEAFSQFSLHNVVFTLLAKANEYIAQEEQVEIKSSIDVSMDEQRVSLKKLQIAALGTTTLADIEITTFLETPLIQGDIAVQAFDAREVAKRVGVALPVMAKAGALSQVALKAKIKLHGETLQANDLNLVLDSSTLVGWLHVLDISKQKIRYELALDHLDLSDYMPPVTATAAETSENNTTAAAMATTKTTGNEKIELPVEMMRKLDVRGDFRIAALTVKEHEIKQFLMSVNARQGKIIMKPVSMQVLEGKIDSTIYVNVQKKMPAYGVDLNVAQVQIGPVVNPFLVNLSGDKPMKIKGAVNVVMDINTLGDSVNQLKKASKGSIVLDMKGTQVDGFDPEFYARKSIADYVHSKGFGLSKTIMGQYKPRDITVFDTIHSTVKLINGKARTDDFLMDSTRVKVTAKGQADIMQDSLDVISSVQLPRAKTAVEKIFNEPLFVRIHGPFEALKYDLDKNKLKKSTTDILKNEAKAKLDKEKQKLKDKAKAKVKAEKKRAKEKVKDKLKNKLKDKFKGLF